MDVMEAHCHSETKRVADSREQQEHSKTAHLLQQALL